MLVKDGRAVMPFGVMGGHYQAVGHATFPAPLARPRHGPAAGRRGAARLCLSAACLQVERGNSEPVVADLARRGHRIEMQEVPLGGCQAIWIDRQRGVLIGGSEPRKDGLALGY